MASVPTDLLSGDNPAPNAADANYVSMEIAQPENDFRNNNDADDDEEIASVSPSIVSSVLTQDGIHDFEGFLAVCTKRIVP